MLYVFFFQTTWLSPRDERGPPVRNRVSKTVWVQKLVVCNGRVPNTANLNLEAAGVDVDMEGGVLVVRLPYAKVEYDA